MAHMVVLDNFFGEPERQGLLDFLTDPGWDHSQGPPPHKWERRTADTAYNPRTWGLKDEVLSDLAAASLAAKLEVQSRLQRLYPEYIVAHMPSDAIQERAGAGSSSLRPGQCNETAPPLNTRPGDGDRTASRQGGQGVEALALAQQACSSAKPQPGISVTTAQASAEHGAGAAGHQQAEGDAVKLQGACATANQAASAHPAPAVHTVTGAATDQPQQLCSRHDRSSNGGDDGDGYDESGAAGPVDCHNILANAAVHGDAFGWHQDADPSTFPDGTPWVQQYGHYFNREPGKPVLVSLLLYLNADWPRDFDAETMFLDTGSDTGVIVRPKAGRAVLMDQDVLHRLSVPSRMAGGTPRYSLVWKLVFVPRRPGQACCIARPEWGRPTPFGSAHRAQQALQLLRRQQQPGEKQRRPVGGQGPDDQHALQGNPVQRRCEAQAGAVTHCTPAQQPGSISEQQLEAAQPRGPAAAADGAGAEVAVGAVDSTAAPAGAAAELAAPASSVGMKRKAERDAERCAR